MTLPRVLVVDDLHEITSLFLALAERMLGKTAEMRTCDDGRAAVELLRRESFDVVVSDFRMREIDGLEVLRASRETNPHGLRILMTGYNEIPASRDRIVDAGIDAYLFKPLRAADAMRLLRDFLARDEDALAAARASAREIESSRQDVVHG